MQNFNCQTRQKNCLLIKIQNLNSFNWRQCSCIFISILKFIVIYGLFSVLHYEVLVYMGNNWAAETDADVYITIFGKKGDTGRRLLYHSQTNSQKFQRGQVSTEIILLLKILIYFRQRFRPWIINHIAYTIVPCLLIAFY